MKKHFIVIFTILLVSSLLSCSDSERRLPYVARYATVKIKMTLPDETASSQVSFIDRILRIIIRDAIAQTAPAAFSGYTVRVTASGMSDIDQTFSSTGALTLSVPAGTSRRFEVTALVDPSDPSAARSFRGITTLDLVSETVTVPVIMNLYETKIVIPDPGVSLFPNRRIVQIDDLTGAGWTARTGSSIGFTGTFMPWDIDFDSAGRIYIATNFSGTGGARVIRMKSINDSTFTLIVDNGTTGIVALAIDRIKHFLYYASSAALTQCSTDGTGCTSLPLNGASFVENIQTITGLDVDSAGILYISGTNTSASSRIFQYDSLLTKTVTRVCSSSYLSSPADIKVKYPYIYVANPGGANNYKILQLDSTLNFVAGYGVQATVTNTNPSYFYGPYRFLAIRNDSLIIIDDYNIGNTNYDKLVSINDILGTGWTTYGSSGSGTGQFSFFYGC
jgi:hypothetical protein